LYALHYNFYHFISKIYINKCEKKGISKKTVHIIDIYMCRYCFSASTYIKLNPEWIFEDRIDKKDKKTIFIQL